MLNIQIRGSKIDLSIHEISEKTKIRIFNQIRSTKLSLAEIIMNQKKNISHTTFQIQLPILTNDSELIVTSFKNDDYYDEGISFFRKKTSDISEIPNKKIISFQNKPYIIISYDIYYGSSFETEILDLDYTMFNNDSLSIEALSLPFFDFPLIEKILFNKKELVNLQKQKEQKVKSKTILYKKRLTSNIKEISEITFPHLFEIVSDSEIDVRKINN